MAAICGSTRFTVVLALLAQWLLLRAEPARILNTGESRWRLWRLDIVHLPAITDGYERIRSVHLSPGNPNADVPPVGLYTPSLQHDIQDCARERVTSQGDHAHHGNDRFALLDVMVRLLHIHST